MQMIEAVIKPQKLDAVKTALAKIGILGATAVEVRATADRPGTPSATAARRWTSGSSPRCS